MDEAENLWPLLVLSYCLGGIIWVFFWSTVGKRGKTTMLMVSPFWLFFYLKFVAVTLWKVEIEGEDGGS